MSVMLRALEFIALFILIFFFLSILIMPWPANLIIGGLVFISFILILIQTRRNRKNGRDTDRIGM